MHLTTGEDADLNRFTSAFWQDARATNHLVTLRWIYVELDNRVDAFNELSLLGYLAHFCKHFLRAILLLLGQPHLLGRRGTARVFFFIESSRTALILDFVGAVFAEASIDALLAANMADWQVRLHQAR